MSIKDRIRFIARSYLTSFMDDRDSTRTPAGHEDDAGHRSPPLDPDEESSRNMSADDFEKQWAAFQKESAARERAARPHGQTTKPHRPTSGSRTIDDCYRDLGCTPGADLATVRKQFRLLMKKHHPDLHAGDPVKQEESNNLSQVLTESYQRLEKILEPRVKK